MNIIVLIITVTAAAFVAVLILLLKKDRASVYQSLLRKIVKEGGSIRTQNLRSIGDIKKVKEILNRMSKDGVLTVNVCDGNNIEYVFPIIPRSYNPIRVNDREDFFRNITSMGINSEDGHVFLSEIIFAFDREYSDIIQSLDDYCESGMATRNISRSGNVYFLFDAEHLIQQQEQ